MTLRDKLMAKIYSIITDAFKCGFDAENSNAIDYFDGFVEALELLEQFAIGKWVPVSERLPVKPGPYMVQWSNKRASNPHDVWFDADIYKDFGGWSVIRSHETITLWLELDIPEVGE